MLTSKVGIACADATVRSAKSVAVAINLVDAGELARFSEVTRAASLSSECDQSEKETHISVAQI